MSMNSETKIVLALIGVFLLCAILSLALNAPPIITSCSMAATLTALVHRFLGGLRGASVRVKTFKATGGLAAFLILMFFINSKLEKYSPVVSPNPDSWIAVDQNGQFIPVTIGRDTYEQNATEFLRDAVWQAGADSGLIRAEQGGHYLASIDRASLERLGLIDRIEMSQGKGIQFSDKLTAGSEFDLSPVYPLKIRATQFKDEYNGFDILDSNDVTVFSYGLLRTRNFQFFEYERAHYLIFVSRANHMGTSEAPWAAFGLTQVSPLLRTLE